MADIQTLVENLSRKSIQIDSLVIEYSAQDMDKIFAQVDVECDETWLLQKVIGYEQYWLGNRLAQGVDIEEAWKCSMCSFADTCHWRIAKAEELKNAANNNP
jgi:exonuclease V